MNMVWLRRASVVLTFVLVACGSPGTSTTGAADTSLSSRLLSGDDIPAGYQRLPLVADVTRRWCGVGLLNTPRPLRRSSLVLMSRPDDATQAILTNTVMVFAPGDATRFVSALRRDERSCNRPQVLLPNGLSISGDYFAIGLPRGGDEQLVMDVRGVARGPALRTLCGGALARIVVRRADVVVVIEDAVAGIQLDTGFRNRLAMRAAEQAELGP
jgi:hypothetical protein